MELFVSRRSTLAAVGLVWVAGCGVSLAGCGSSDDDRTVAGRTRSVSEVAAVPTLRATLELLRSTDQATGVTEVALTARLLGPPETRSVSLRTPAADAAELPLEDRGGGSFELRIDGPAATMDARFPAGIYALLAVLSDGSLPTLSLDARRAAPSPPVIEEPADMALGVSLAPRVAWRADDTGLFDVVIREASSGAVRLEARDVAGESLQIPPGVLAPTTRYQLEISAVSAHTGEPVRLSAGNHVVFDTEAAQ